MLARVGEHDRAMQQLDLTYKAHDHVMLAIKADDAFEGMRSDPRFIAVLRRMKFAS